MDGEGTLRIVDALTLDVLHSVLKAGKIVAWSPDGRQIATGDITGRVRAATARQSRSLLTSTSELFRP
jgi:hypothetical protein